MAQEPPGKGLLGWLGRQVGHVRSAWRTDVAQRTVHREVKVQEAPLPGSENVTLRRTTIDEVVVKKESKQ